MIAPRYAPGEMEYWTFFSRPSQTKEARAVPVCPGDLVGDGRQARIDLSLPTEPVGYDCYLVEPALILADNDGADLEMACPVGARIGDRCEEP